MSRTSGDSEDVVVMTFYLEIITRLLWLTRANAGAPAAAVPAPAPPVMPAPTPALTAAVPDATSLNVTSALNPAPATHPFFNF